MRKNSKNNELVTKSYLKERMDLIEKRLNERMDKRIDTLMKYIDFKLEPIEEFRKEFTDFKERVLKTLDWLVGTYQKFDEEHTVSSEQYSRMTDKVENHEKRIATLEQHTAQ